MNEKNSCALLPSIICVTSFTLVLFVMIMSEGFFPSQALAQTSRTDELKQSISSREDDIKKIEQEIAEYQARLIAVGGQKKTLQTAIQTLDLTRAKLGKDILLTQKKIERTNATIGSLGRDIGQKEERIKKDYRLISDIINKINQSDSGTLLEMLLSSESISTFLEEADDLDRLQASIRDSIKSLERAKTELTDKRISFQAQHKELLLLNSQLGDQKEIADDKRKEHALLFSTTKNQESNYQKLLNERIARKKQFEKEIDDFEAQLRAEIDPNSFPSPGTKVLAYPVDNVRITQKFGKTVDAKRLYASGTHNGVDFAAPIDTPIKAAGDGVVVGTGDTDLDCRWASYGRWVMIQHRNGLSTLYGHLDLIKVAKGQQVTIGQLIGYSGNTGYSTGPHLHFTLFVSSAVNITDLPSKSCRGAVFHLPVAAFNGYLDPQDYL